VLDLPLEQITLHTADSAVTPPAGATAGSKTLYYCSHAAFMAAEVLRTRLLQVATTLLEVREEELLFSEGGIYARDHSGRGLTLSDVIAEARKRGIDWLDFTFGTHAAEVVVDEDTGEVTVLKYACCHDVGQAIHPQSVAGQMHGGVAQGIGFTLMEQVISDNGCIQTPSLREYLVPTSVDIPDISTIILASGEGLGAFANRGIGEPPAAASAGAIANAIYDAVGARITELPITPERVFNALQCS
jgi:CO/xanthine dehydrogenase Mo-binding subunit